MHLRGKQSGILCPLVLPGGASTLSIGNPLRMTDYAFQVTRNPPDLGAHGAEVFEDWQLVPKMGT
jgi:succinate--hydroxymethylglutarate CoA-transferase